MKKVYEVAAMDKSRQVKISKYLSKHLRHTPERLGLTLALGGWVSVDELLAACAAHQFPLTRAESHRGAAAVRHRAGGGEGLRDARTRALRGRGAAGNCREGEPSGVAGLQEHQDIQERQG